MHEPKCFKNCEYPDHVCKLLETLFRLKKADSNVLWKLMRILCELDFQKLYL